MIEISLPIEAEQRLTDFARKNCRAEDEVVRDWVFQRLAREEINELIRNANSLDSVDRQRVISIAAGGATDAQLRWLDAEDGGYDWRPSGPPEAISRHETL